MRTKGIPATGLAAIVALVFSACTVWTQVGHETMASLTQGQGLATVVHADGSTSLFYDGVLSVPSAKSAAGWNHVGDPDSASGLVVQPYQNAQASVGQKLFAVTAPDGTETDFVHHDVAGEQYNNSFDAISPDGRWMVSGEWDDMTRLLIMPTPLLNPAATDPSADLPLTGQIQLDATVTDVQGCDFATPTELLCSSDDPITEHGMPRKSYFRVDLAHPLDGATVAAHVSTLGVVPQTSTCAPTGVGSWPDDYEVEGVDVDTVAGLFRVEMVPPGACGVTGDVFVYQQQDVT
jgi:hypothetical protein